MALPGYVGSIGSPGKRQTALITGASSGIGLDLAELMAPDFDLIITARSQQKLEQLGRQLEASHGNHVHVIPADLARAEAPIQLLAEIARRGL